MVHLDIIIRRESTLSIFFFFLVWSTIESNLSERGLLLVCRHYFHLHPRILYLLEDERGTINRSISNFETFQERFSLSFNFFYPGLVSFKTQTFASGTKQSKYYSERIISSIDGHPNCSRIESQVICPW